MAFNFGSTPFKHPPKGGYVAICEAPQDCIVNNECKGGGSNKPQKYCNNAPQAIIIEVGLIAYVL